MKILMWGTQKARDSKWIDNLCALSHSLPFTLTCCTNRSRPQSNTPAQPLLPNLLTFTTRSNFYLFISYKAKHPKSSRAEHAAAKDSRPNRWKRLRLRLRLLGMQRVVSTIHNHPSIHLRSVCLSPGQTGKQKPSAKHRTIANWLTICTVGTFQCRNQVDNNCWKSTKNVTRTSGIHSQ